MDKKDKLVRLVRRLKKNPELVVDMDSHLSEDIGLDSLDSLEFLMESEEILGVRLPDDLAELTTLNKLLKYADSQQIT